MKLRVYLETTVFNFFFDTHLEGHAETVRIFEAIGRSEYEGYTSRYVTFELENAPEPKRSNMMTLVNKYGITVLDFDDEADRLAKIYVQNGVMTEKRILDATHIAIASIYGLDCILSFNFQHINKLKTQQKTTSINLREGYQGITICTPEEVFTHGKTKRR